MTNADNIRRMNNEQLENLMLALILVNRHGPKWPKWQCNTCPADEYCAARAGKAGRRDKMFEFPCPDMIRGWLKEETI